MNPASHPSDRFGVYEHLARVLAQHSVGVLEAMHAELAARLAAAPAPAGETARDLKTWVLAIEAELDAREAA